jgi:hypothetical protein
MSKFSIKKGQWVVRKLTFLYLQNQGFMLRTFPATIVVVPNLPKIQGLCVFFTRVPIDFNGDKKNFLVLVFEGKKMIVKIWCTNFHPSALYKKGGTTKLEARIQVFHEKNSLVLHIPTAQPQVQEWEHAKVFLD